MQFESERLGPDESGGEDVIDLRRIVRTLMSRKWWVIGSIVASLALALLYSSVKTPLYQTRAKLLVDGGRRGSRSPGSIMDLAAGMEGERSLSTQLQIILARRRTEAAARLVAIRQILLHPTLTTPDDEADDTALFLEFPAEITNQLAPRLKDIKDNVDLDALRTSKNLTADPLEILLDRVRVKEVKSRTVRAQRWGRTFGYAQDVVFAR